MLVLTFLIVGCSTDRESGRLRVGFDIDDTVLFSRDIFDNLPADKVSPIDFGWVNTHDREYSLPITPVIELIEFYRAHGHEVFFITARAGGNGDSLAVFLSDLLGFTVKKDINLFFDPKEAVGGYRYTSKHRRLKKLGIDLYFGDSDSDMVAALKAGAHPVRIVRHQLSIDQYGKNYFGDTTDGTTAAAPIGADDLRKFHAAGVGIFGETIYPLVWDGPPNTGAVK
ncbi:MAG: HAD family acid phosphatase [Candidatus Neomarinimicrobiota bacterium]